MKTKMFLITDSFPYGKGEKPFIIPELPYLVENYDVTIITRASKEVMEDTENVTELDESIKVIKITDHMKQRTPNPLQVKIRKLYLLDKRVREEYADIIKGENAEHRIKYMLSYYAKARRFLKALRKAGIPLDSRETVVFYTYWNTFATLALLMCKEKNPNLKVITRTHRYDLYNEATICGRQPFRSYVNSVIDAIFFISQKGMDYYIEQFAQGVGLPTFHLSRLGIHDYNTKDSKIREKKFHIVSCSFVVPVKRVELIIKALQEIDDEKEIHWTHFGDGQELLAVKQQASDRLDDKENISYTFTGFMSNQSILEYYQEHYVDGFITTSSSEGIPVSIMEACSFGIPVIATNVGGIAEIVEDQVNGLLLSANPEINEIVDAIEQIYDSSEESVTAMRNNSRKIWEERYNGDKNFLEFVNCIKNEI